MNRDWIADIKWGVRWGLRFAGALSGIAIIVGLVVGLTGRVPWQVLLATLGLAVVTYFAGGVVAGGVVGLLRPAAGTWLGTVAVAFVAGLAVALLGLTSLEGFDRLGTPAIAAAVFMALVWALIAGTMNWRRRQYGRGRS